MAPSIPSLADATAMVKSGMTDDFTEFLGFLYVLALFILFVVFIIKAITHQTIYNPYVQRKMIRDRNEKQSGNVVNSVYRVYGNAQSGKVVDEDGISYKLCDFFCHGSHHSIMNTNYDESMGASLDVLDIQLQRGVRAFHFGIYPSVPNRNGDIAVVSAGRGVTGTCLTPVPFSQVCQRLSSGFYPGNTTPNHEDPMFIILELNTKRKDVLDNAATSIRQHLGKHILSQDYLCTTDAQIESMMYRPIDEFKQKVIICCVGKGYESTQLREYVNVPLHRPSEIGKKTGPFPTFRAAQTTREETNIEECIDYNKTHLTVVHPDTISVNKHPVYGNAWNLGCQIVLVPHHLREEPVFRQWFNKKSFLLKDMYSTSVKQASQEIGKNQVDTSLRRVTIARKKPVEQDKRVSYAPRSKQSALGNTITI